MPRLPAPELPAWLDKMLPFHRYRIESGDVTFHVTESGSGLPVLMLHGNPMWGFLYRKVATRLGKGLRAVMPDLIGLGFSSRPDTSWHTLENHAASLLALIRELNLRRFVLVGHDWGGPIGLLAASQIPDQLAGVVLLNTVVGPPRPGFRPAAFHRFSRLPVVSEVAFRLLGFPQNMVWTVQKDRGSIAGDVARAYRFPLRGLARNTAPLALARMVPHSFFHSSIRGLQRVQDFVGEIDGPGAIVWGDNDPILGSVRSRIEALLPQARVIRTGAGHYLQEEVPEQVAEGIHHVCGSFSETGDSGSEGSSEEAIFKSSPS